MTEIKEVGFLADMERQQKTNIPNKNYPIWLKKIHNDFGLKSKSMYLKDYGTIKRWFSRITEPKETIIMYAQIVAYSKYNTYFSFNQFKELIKNKVIEVHHIDGCTTNDTFKNLLILLKKDHIEVHKGNISAKDAEEKAIDYIKRDVSA